MYFDFYGAFDPAEITRRLGVKPTSQFRAGEPRPTGVGSRRRDGWIIEVGAAKTFEIDDLLKQLKAAVTASPADIQKVTRELNVDAVVTCEVQSTSSMPSLYFASEFVQWAAAVGAAIDVDIMLLEKDEEAS